MAERRPRVVVGVTGSLANLAALHTAVTEARAANALLIAVHTWESLGAEVTARRSGWPMLIELQRKQARATLSRAFDDAFGGEPPVVECPRIVLRGSAVDALVQLANQHHDLIVVGTGRRTGVRRLWPSAVAKRCAQRACCPVLAVPPPDLIHELSIRGRRRHDRAPFPTTLADV